MAVGLGSLEIELLAWILEFVVDTSQSTTKSLALVSKHFYSTTKLVGHRYKTILYSIARGATGKVTDLTSWLDNDEILRGVRYLTIEPHHPPYGDRSHPEDQDRETLERAKFDDLITLISRLGNLKKLIWSFQDPIPASVLEALHQHHQKAKLTIWDWCRWDDSADHTDTSEVALSQSPALTLIRAQIWNHGAGMHPDLREVAFKRIVASAPNLQSASVITGHSGCVVSFPSTEQVQEIIDMSRLFYASKRPNGALRSLTLDGYGLTENTLRTWSQFVDLSRLTSLKCSRGVPDISYFNYAPTILSSLKHVSLNLSHHGDSLKQPVETYITTCAPLESLSLWSWHDVVSLSSILHVHGPTLKTLQLHERETTGHHGSLARKLLSPGQIKQIQTECPHLQDFSFDLDRHSRSLESELSEDAEIFDLVATMGLDKLQIYYDLGLPSLSRPYSTISLPASIESDADADADSDSDDGDDENENENQNQNQNDDENPVRPSAFHPSPTSQPPKAKLGSKGGAKRPKPSQPLSPTSNPNISAFAGQLWKAVFGERQAGRRALDLKFGEWERKMGTGYPAPWVLQEQRLRTYWMVRPKQRDDERFECEITRKGGGYETEALLPPSSEDEFDADL